MKYKFGYLIIFSSLIFSGCKLTKIKTSCLISANESPALLKKKIIYQIDSFYRRTPNTKLKRIIGSNCINDTIVEIRVLNNFFIYDMFYFNNKIQLTRVTHQLKEVY